MKSKKKKNQDFQKVKLKVGKRLKKADNVTNASFKTRSVQISQHLKTGESSQPSTKKHQNINELFTQCRHYSGSVRLEAVNGLKELLTSNPQLLSPNLSDILERAAELLIDKDGSVRQAAVRLFKLFLPMVSDKQISPFFPLLCAHLCCAMTHIYDEIQEDSLSVLDLLLETFPKLMITRSSQVLPNFIEQISRRQGQGQAKRSLSTNPNSSTSSVKWRVSVLNRLHKFLGALLKYRMFESSSDRDGNTALNSSDSPNVDEVLFNTESGLFVQACPSRNKAAWNMPGFILGGIGLNNDASNSDVLDGQLMEYTNTLIPLMLECWIECAPSKQSKHVSGNLLSGESVDMMYSILQVTQLLWQCIHSLDQDKIEGTFQRRKYMKEFHQHFMSNFPYSINEVSAVKKKKKTATPSVQVTAEMLNLTICDIMTYFIRGDNSSCDLTWLPMVTLYLNDFISGGFGGTHIGQCSRTFVNIIERLLSSGVEDDTMLGIIVDIFNRYEAANINSTEKSVYLHFFAEKMVADGDLACLSPDLRRKFLRSLPSLLAQCSGGNTHMSEMLIDTMKKAACQRCADMIDKSSLSVLRQQWFDPGSGVLSRLSSGYQRELISLLYHLPTIDIDLMRTIVRVVRCEQYSEDTVTYLIQVVQARYLKSWHKADIAVLHIGFLTNLILGMSQDVIEHCVQQSTMTAHSLLGEFTIIPPDTGDEVPSLDRHCLLIQNACKSLSQFHNTDQAVQVVLEHLQNTVLNEKVVPLQVAFGICKFAESLDCIPSEFETLVNQLTISFVSHLVTCHDSANQETVKMMKDVCCGLMVKSRNGLDKLLETASIQSKEELYIDRLDILLKTVMLFLTEGRHSCVQGHPTRIQSLCSFQSALKGYTETHKEFITSDIDTMFINFNYLLSSVQ